MRHATTLATIGGILALIAPADASAQTESPPKSGLRIESRSVVFAYPNDDPYDRFNLYGFNHAPSVVRMADGELLCAWFSGTYEASVHQVILGAYARDDGRTWDRAFVLQDTPRVSDFDPAFIADGSRTWFIYTAGRHIRWPFVKNEAAEVGPDSFFIYTRSTEDNGRTWSQPVRIHQGGSRSNGIQLTSGELLLPVHALDGKGPAGILKSIDGGKTWKRFGEVTTPHEQDEPTIAELAGGEILMVLRTGDGFLWTVKSKDRGETWEKPQRSDIPAARASHNVFRLNDGRILLTHGESRISPRTPLTMRLSTDGMTWQPPLVLAEIVVPGKDELVWDRQVTYPSVTQLKDGTIVVVWTEIGLGDTVESGIIRSARVRLQ